LVRITLKRFSKPWDAFICGIVAREKLPNWGRLWDDFTQEEMRVGSNHAKQQRGVNEENVALTRKGKSKTKKGSSGGATSKGEKKRDMSKVKCFACQKIGHYASQFPNMKKKEKSKVAASTEVDEFSAKFKKDFSLAASPSSKEVSTHVWYISNGASSHMTGV